MRTFSESVDKRSRGSMKEFLAGHFRYNTMNGWNNSTSYACNMKIYNLGLERDIANKLYDLIQLNEFYEPINDLIYEFGAAHNFEWQVGFNGRSGGYLVLYRGERKPSGYRSFCTACGQKNYKSVSESGSVCGRCHQPARRDFSQTHMNIHTFPGRGIDHGERFFLDWDMTALRDRVDLVCEFDKLADDIVAEAVYIAKNYDIQDEVVYVPQTRKVMVEVSA